MKDKNRFYYNKDFLGSPDGRPIRILAEYFGPIQKIKKSKIKDTIVFFGSARTQKKQKTYKYAKELSYKLTKWSIDLKDKQRRFIITSGAGPGIMEAANEGASKAGGITMGLGITLPFEQSNNKWISKELDFSFHYFFMRKFWFLYLAKGIVVWPGGVGTLDELFEVLTLIQTKKIKKELPIVLFDTEFWNTLINWDFLVEKKVIDKEDLDLFLITDSIDEAFEFLTSSIKNRKLSGPNF